jgi:hypothetical protein
LKVHYRYRETFYHITIRNHAEKGVVGRLVLDGAELSDDFVTLIDDRQDHQIEVAIHPSETPTPSFHSV